MTIRARTKTAARALGVAQPPARRQVVCAWLERGVRAADLALGERRGSAVEILVPRAVMWKSRSSGADLGKARAWANSEKDYDIVVIEMPASERDPLGEARKIVLGMAGKLRLA